MFKKSSVFPALVLVALWFAPLPLLAQQDQPPPTTNAAPARPVLLTGKRLNTGGFELQVSGATGQLFRVQVSHDLGQWTDVGMFTNTGPAGRFIDPDTNPFPVRFYRLVAPAPPPRPDFGIRELYLIEQIDRRPGAADAIARIAALVKAGTPDQEIIDEMSAAGWPSGWTRYKISLNR